MKSTKTFTSEKEN